VKQEFRKRALIQAKEDEGSTKGKILKAAQELFAKRGLKGATTREIADSAGVNIALIHYHWGSKAELWNAVHSDILEKSKEFALDVATKYPRIDNAEDLERLFEMVFDFMADNPNLPRLWNLPGQEGAEKIWPEERRRIFKDDFMTYVLKNTNLDFGPADPDIVAYCISGMARVFFYWPDQVEIYFGEDSQNLSKEFRKKVVKAMTTICSRAGQMK